MDRKPLASKLFDDTVQRDFAKLSGDFNPLHMDPIYARRTQMGKALVHGVNTLLWGLDAVLSKRPEMVPVQVRARFLKPLYVGESAMIFLTARPNPTEKLIEIETSGTVIAEIVIHLEAGALATPVADRVDTAPSASPSPIELTAEQMAGRTGAVPLASVDACAAAFPALAVAIGPQRVGALLATTRVVGMECPGLYSLYSGLAITLNGQPKDTLRYAVTRYDHRFRAVRIEVSGGGVNGLLETFFRLPPTAQPSISEVMARVDPRAYVGQRALIVGGSRGLGEVTAKIIAAGGGHPIITYASGRAEAQAVADDIHAGGGICDILHYDVRKAAKPQLKALSKPATHLYYFATSQIFLRKSSLHEPRGLREFIAFYVDGFAALCEVMAAAYPKGLRVFYPSSVAVNQPVKGLGEYAMAKAAGELLCDHLVSFLPGLSVVVKRLPRILTDQTATVALAEAEAALDIMLPIVAEMAAQAGVPAGGSPHKGMALASISNEARKPPSTSSRG